MDRKPAKGDPVRRADDDDTAGRIGPPRPRPEGSCGDRAGINDAGMWRDHHLRRHAAVGPDAFGHLPDEVAKLLRPGWIEQARNLRGMNFVQHLGPQMPDQTARRPLFANVSMRLPARQCAALQSALRIPT